MKNLYILILLISTSFAASSQQYGWTDISDNIPGSPDLSDVFFVSDDVGWITSSSQAEIYHTTDGGETFEIQTTQYYCNAIYMISEAEGYAGGANGRVYRTTDGGENWITIGSIGVTLSDIDFATTTQGYCCGDNGAVFSITPQGITNLNSGLASDLAGISAPSVDNVWVVGGGYIVHYDGSVFVFQSGPVGSYNAIVFIDDTEGWVFGSGGLLGHTIVAGSNWVNQAPGSPNNESLFDAHFLTAEIGWAVGANGAIIKTVNGGEIWETVGSELATSLLRGVHFTSPTNGYVVGNENTLLKYGELTGVADNDLIEIDFEVFPNPCADKIQITKPKDQNNSTPVLSGAEGFNPQPSKLEIIDITGRVVLSLELQGEENTINVSCLSAGVYFVKLQTEEAVGVRKIIIQ